jgi:membrane-associated phospholipid phosphatase
MDSNDPPKKPAKKLPKQQLGDTPVAPWEMPTPAEKAKAEPARQALQNAVEKVDSPEKADEVAERLEQIAGKRKAGNVEQAAKTGRAARPGPAGGGDKLAESAQAVKQAAQAPAAPPAEKASDVIAQTVQAIDGTKGRDREALAQAAQEVLNPEQQGGPADSAAHHREYLRRAFIKRMHPLDALDAEIYLGINHLPHNRPLNDFFYLLTLIFKGGAAWYGLIGLLTLLDHRRGRSLPSKVAVPLALAAAAVEFPVKTFFRRRRPFITIIKATVIGKKPGSWSFPSGHSAAAFGGAYLLGKQYPRQRWLFYLLAGLVAFSRIYLGDHYPGDVLSGSLSGIALAKGASALQEALDKAQSKANPF